MAYTGSKAKSGRGTVVSIGAVTGTTGTEVFTPIYELMSCTPSGGEWGYADTTNFNSGVDNESIQTIRSEVSWTIKGNLVDTDPGQQALVAAYNAGGNYDWKVQLKPGPNQTTGTLYTFSGSVQSYFDFQVDIKDALQFTAKIRQSGAVIPTYGA